MSCDTLPGITQEHPPHEILGALGYARPWIRGEINGSIQNLIEYFLLSLCQNVSTSMEICSRLSKWKTMESQLTSPKRRHATEKDIHYDTGTPDIYLGSIVLAKHLRSDIVRASNHVREHVPCRCLSIQILLSLVNQVLVNYGKQSSAYKQLLKSKANKSESFVL